MKHTIKTIAFLKPKEHFKRSINLYELENRRMKQLTIINVYDSGTAIYIIRTYFQNQRDDILDFLLRINIPVARAFYEWQMQDIDTKEIKEISPYAESVIRDSSSQMADFWVDSYTDQYTKVVEKNPYMNPEDVALAFDDDLGKTERIIGEVVRVSNGASFEAAKDSGKIYWKQWISENDGRVRPTHRQAHGQIVPLNSNFAVGLDLLMYPREIGGSFAETANCRCHVYYIKEGETVTGWYRPEGPQ